MILLTAVLFLWLSATTVCSQPAHASVLPTTSFASFDQRARAGDHLNVVFFGASLTWGANSSDPELTSYRADVARKFESDYPKAHFTFWNSAIGGTGSQLGVYRLQRDCLRHHPDLVFLDFTANDNVFGTDELSLESYESLVRRIIVQGHAPVVQMIFPFKGDVARMKMDGMARRTAHLAISAAYHTAVGDAIALGQQRVKSGKDTIKELWPIDGVHPGDTGYQMFADAAWQGYQSGLSKHLVCQAPAKMLHADTFMNAKRVPISSLGPLPAGWHVGIADRVSAYYDMLMSRWLDSEVIATDAPGRKGSPPAVTPQLLNLRFTGSFVMLYGEGTQNSGKYRVLIDGQPVMDKGQPEFDAGTLGRRAEGNVVYDPVIASGLDPTVSHTLTIIPDLNPTAGNELRIESVCVAGGKPNSSVTLAASPSS